MSINRQYPTPDFRDAEIEGLRQLVKRTDYIKQYMDRDISELRKAVLTSGMQLRGLEVSENDKQHAARIYLALKYEVQGE
jgi:hypothetical protein